MAQAPIKNNTAGVLSIFKRLARQKDYFADKPPAGTKRERFQAELLTDLPNNPHQYIIALAK
jgi:hypothetical protein